MGMSEILSRIDQCKGEASDRSLSLSAGMSSDGLRNWRRKVDAGDDTVSATVKHLSGIADCLGVSETWLIHGVGDGPRDTPSVAVPGKVGAGAPVELFDDFAKGDGLYHVACPPQISCHGVVAVEVEGDSMEPVYSPGDILFFSRATHEGVPTEAIGKKVVAETEDGKVWVKLLRPGTEPGLFHLLSINPTGTNMHDVKLKWASPVRMHLPAELVARVKQGQ